MILSHIDGCRRASRLGLTGLGLLLLATTSSAQAGTTADTTRGRVERELIARAEAEGVTHQRSSLNWSPPARFDQVHGTGERKCMESKTDFGPVRSGEFVVGGQLAGTYGLNPGLTRKIWWTPLYYQASMTLSVSAYSITAPGRSFTWSSSRVAFGSGQGVENREYFFPSGFTVPEAGRWLVVATANRVNWGCFIITVTEAAIGRSSRRSAAG
jgi:hypothetical protein